MYYLTPYIHHAASFTGFSPVCPRIRRLVATTAFVLGVTSLGCAEPVDRSKAEDNYFTQTDGLFRYYAPGIIRPDEGTVQLTVRIDKPLREFGNDWDFVFSLAPSRKFTTTGNTLMGLYIPPLPKGDGLAFLARGAAGQYYSLQATDFSFKPGERINLAFSWGKTLALYVNGELKGSRQVKDSIDENVFSYCFSVERFAPFSTESLKISTKALSVSELARNPAIEFTTDEHTSLLATSKLTVAERPMSVWQRESGYTTLVPVWRGETQCFSEGERVFFPFVSINFGKTPKEYEVGFTVKNMRGTVVLTKTEKLTVPPDGNYHIHEVPLTELAKPNYYLAEVSIGPADAKRRHAGAIAVLPKYELAKTGRLARYYGQHQHYDFDATMFHKIGVRSTRAWAGGSVLLWHEIEPVKGQFRWEKADAWVKMCRKADMDILGVLGYPSRWAAVEPDEAHKQKHGLASRPGRWKPRSLEEWGNYVFETVKRYKNDVEYWEIYNEVNFCPPDMPASFSGSTEEYLGLLKTAYTQAKKANPACKVLVSGFSASVNKQMPLALLRLGAANYFDIFNVHGYSGVEGVAPWITEFRKQKPTAPYWMTEQMWHQLENTSKRLYLTIAYYVQFLEAGCERYYNMGSNEVFFDRFTFSPRPDYYVTGIFQHYISSCEGYAGKYLFPQCESFSLRHNFRRTDGMTLSILGSESGAYELALQGRIISASDIVGQPVALTTRPGGTAFVNSNVAYVVSQGPLRILSATPKTRLVLYANGGFEETEGDIGMGGLAAGKPRQWAFRDKTNDPQGSIHLSEQAHSGKYAILVASSGKGRVYAYQHFRIPAPGKYVLSAYLKKVSGNASLEPHLYCYDIERKKIEKKSIRDITNEYRKYLFEVELQQTQDFSIGVGINSGAGKVLIDDVVFDKVSAPVQRK